MVRSYRFGQSPDTYSALKTGITQAIGVWNLNTTAAYIARGDWPPNDPYFNQISLLLHGDGAYSGAADGQQNNTFLDSSTNNFTMTRGGNTYQGTISPFSRSSGNLDDAPYDPLVHGGSGYFDAGGDLLTAPSDTALTLGTGNFTLQGWFYCTANNTYQRVISIGGTGFFMHIWNQNALSLRINGTGYFYGTNNTSTGDVGTGNLPINQWNHVAIVRISGNFYAYINGDLTITVTAQSGYNISSSLRYYGSDNGTEPYYGYMSGIQLIKGTAIYSGSTIDVPTVPPTAVSGTSLLLNFTNAGIFDQTGKNSLETIGNAQVDTTTKKFGAGSIEFDGTGDALYVASNSSLYLSTGNFTIEGWVYTTDSTISQVVMIKRAAQAARGFVMSINGFVSQKLSFACGDSDTAVWEVQLDSTTSLANNTWYHFAVVRDGNDFELFINGVSEDTANSSVVIADDTSLLRIGLNDAGAAGLNGFIDDLRITKGVARYTANFTPPTKAFPNG